MTARLVDGWLVCDGPASGTVEIAAGERAPGDWVPAYIDHDDGRPVVKIRPPAGIVAGWRVWVRIDGVESAPSRVT